MTKKDLIESICGMNGKISPHFLANFSDEELEGYLSELRRESQERQRSTREHAMAGTAASSLKIANSR